MVFCECIRAVWHRDILNYIIPSWQTCTQNCWWTWLFAPDPPCHVYAIELIDYSPISKLLLWQPAHAQWGPVVGQILLLGLCQLIAASPLPAFWLGCWGGSWVHGNLGLGFKMGTGIPVVFPKWVPWVQVWFWILAHHGTPCTPRCCGYSMGKLQWVIFTIHYFYSHFFPIFFSTAMAWCCGNFGMLSHKYHYYFLILAVQLLTYIVSYFRVHQLLISHDFFTFP